MSALQLDWIWAVGDGASLWPEERQPELQRVEPVDRVEEEDEEDGESDPPISLAFYRKHTQRILRRYLYASMQVGRAPSILNEPIGRGWVSSRPVRTFEDAVIFVLDVEKCLERLGVVDKALLSRIVLQDYTQAEAAALLGISARTVSTKFPLALDRLTERLMEYGVLVVPD